MYVCIDVDVANARFRCTLIVVVLAQVSVSLVVYGLTCGKPQGTKGDKGDFGEKGMTGEEGQKGDLVTYPPQQRASSHCRCALYCREKMEKTDFPGKLAEKDSQEIP